MGWWRRGVGRRRSRGQTLVLFTMLAAAFIGFLALVVDMGFAFGQRRFDQNGADAGTLAVAQLLALNVSPLNNGGTQVYLSLSDAEAYSKARQYAGLDSTFGSTSTTPTGTNQNTGLNGRN